MVALGFSGAALAQACSMCYNDAAATHASGIRALQHGTLILGVPVLTMFFGILLMAYRHRNRFNELHAPGQAFGPELNEWADPDDSRADYPPPYSEDSAYGASSHDH